MFKSKERKMNIEVVKGNNMALWDAVKQPPKDALKSIGAGRLKGMTDISPQWRIKAMTEYFGPVGTGWKYTVDKLWTEPGADGAVMCFVMVSVYYKNGSEWSDGVPGIGGSGIILKERNGLYTQDEGYKMAMTDALSVALKALGIAADIYAGKWDGSKYRDDQPSAAQNRPTAAPQPPKSRDYKPVLLDHEAVKSNPDRLAFVQKCKLVNEGKYSALKAKWVL